MKLTAEELRLPAARLPQLIVKALLLDRVEREFDKLNADRAARGLTPVHKSNLPDEPSFRAAASLTDAWLTSDRPIMETSDNRQLPRRLTDLRSELILLRSDPALPAVLREALRTLPAPDADVLQLWVDLRDHLRSLLDPSQRRTVSELLRTLDVEALEGLTPGDDDEPAAFYALVMRLRDVRLSENIKNALTPTQYPSTRSQREWLRAAIDAALHDHHPDEHQEWPVRTLVDLPWPPGETDRLRPAFERGDLVTQIREWLNQVKDEIDPIDYPDAEALVDDVLRTRSWAGEYTVPPAGTPGRWSTATVRDLMRATVTFAQAAQDAGLDVAAVLTEHRARALADQASVPLQQLLAWLEDARADVDAAARDEETVARALDELAAVDVLTFCHLVMQALLGGPAR